MKRLNFVHSSVIEKVIAGNFLRSLSFTLFIRENGQVTREFIFRDDDENEVASIWLDENIFGNI